jgi:hypothetical protein
MKNVKITDKDLINVWEAYADKSVPTDKFRQMVIDIILNARAPNYTMVEQIKKINNRDLLVKKLTDFQSKGNGFGVI